MKISIVIPALNEEKALPETLRSLAAHAPGCEVIVVDGGSTDATRAVVERFDAMPIRWVDAPRGRGNQMNAGAAVAHGDVLLFLHADTQPPSGLPGLISHALSNPAALGGFFRIEFVPHAPLANFYTWCYNLRSHLRIFYGDAGLFVRKEVFEQMQGYRAALLMEDVEFILRLRRLGHIAYVRGGVMRSSARRFPSRPEGVRMLAIWFWLHILNALCVSQERLARYYPEKR